MDRTRWTLVIYHMGNHHLMGFLSDLMAIKWDNISGGYPLVMTNIDPGSHPGWKISETTSKWVIFRVELLI